MLGFNATQIHEELNTVYGQSGPSYRTVAHWVHRFLDGRESLADNPRSGRSVTVVIRQNIAFVKDLVDIDPHISLSLIHI